MEENKIQNEGQSRVKRKFVLEKKKLLLLIAVVLIIVLVIAGVGAIIKKSTRKQLGVDGEVSQWVNTEPGYTLVSSLNGEKIQPSQMWPGLEWPVVGVWRGFLPCEDCLGTEIELRLYRENGAMTGDPYQLITVDHGRTPPASPTIRAGIWTTLAGTLESPSTKAYMLDYDKPGEGIFFEIVGDDLEKLDSEQKHYPKKNADQPQVKSDLPPSQELPAEENISQSGIGGDAICAQMGGKWLAEYNECEKFEDNEENQRVCVESGGKIDQCASECRHTNETTCPDVCVTVCRY